MLLHLRYADPLTAVLLILASTYSCVGMLVIGALARSWQRDRAALVALRAALEAQVQAAVAAREAVLLRDKRHRRLRALGQVSAGVAHEFNNILQVISGSLEMIARQPDGDRATHMIDLAQSAVEHGAVITRRLVAFAHRAPLHPVRLDMASVLAMLRDPAAHLLGPQITLSLVVPTDLPMLLADQVDLDAALLNLAANARDAMPEGGALTIAVGVTEIGIEGHPRATLGPGRYITIAVTDTGIGMDGDTLARATDPFFTTKAVGYGSGLGLSMAKGFAEQSGGNLVIDSAPGIGTTVTLWLPANGLEH